MHSLGVKLANLPESWVGKRGATRGIFWLRYHKLGKLGVSTVGNLPWWLGHSQWVWNKNTQFEDCYPGSVTFHVRSCVTLIKYLNLSILIWSMGTMMIIPPLDACVPAKNRWP